MGLLAASGGHSVEFRVFLCRCSVGSYLAALDGVMPARRVLDRQPGAVPTTHQEDDSLVVLLGVVGAPDQVKLRLRCTRRGEILASVVTRPVPPKA